MSDPIYNLWSTVISSATLLVAIVGLSATYWQLKKVKESNWSVIHSTLCDQSLELIKLCIDKPQLYDYFYHRKELAPNDPEETHVYLIAESFANFMEQLVLQQDNLPTDQWQVWHRFIESTFKASLVVGYFIRDHRDWYSSALLKIADESRVKYN